MRGFPMIRVLLAFMATMMGTLTRVARLRMNEGENAAKPIGQLAGWLEYREFLQSVDLGSVAAATAENEDMTVTGIAVGDIPIVVIPAEGLVANVAVTALGPAATANVLRMRVANPTAGAIDAAAINMIVGVFRPL
jgi:hypothetical protein